MPTWKIEHQGVRTVVLHGNLAIIHGVKGSEMKLFYKGKDGGPESKVTGYWLIEAKGLFSIALLKLEDGSREAYHSHAFNAVSWLLKGKLQEDVKVSGRCRASGEYWDGDYTTTYTPSFKPIYTSRDNMHKVSSVGTSWALTFRGPWAKQWKEYIPATGEEYTLESGRVRVD